MIIKNPAKIEETSMQIIGSELSEMGITIPEENRAAVFRAIHASADLDYATNLVFTDGAVRAGVEALKKGAAIITDTNMMLSGVHKKSLERYGNDAVCYMSDPEVAAKAKELDTTRAEVSMITAASKYPEGIYAVGNAPTALLKLADMIEDGMRPSLVVGVPVGFVNIIESKDRALEVCRQNDVPAIIACGRKGGSSVGAAILNALIYEAAGRE